MSSVNWASFGLSEALAVIELGTSILRGNRPTSAEILAVVGPLTDLVPVEELRPYLDAQSKRFVDDLVDMAEDAKVGP